MLINLKVKTLDARTHDFNIDNDISIREFKDKIAEKTSISAENQRLIYQGRVLADERLVKDYDVDGKVLHVAERPPFSQRASTSTSSSNTNPRDPRLPRSNASSRSNTSGTMRNSPLFRAIDGMLVGTMTIPLTTQPAHAQPSPASANASNNGTFASSSSFCMNRITVARHMINCANNIAAYLENPEVGLNNPSLDILERGRWTMESTVVEVGVTASELPRNQNIIDMVQGAVTAALSRNNRNYTVVQLPSVYTSNDESGAGNDAASARTRGTRESTPNVANADASSIDADDAGGIDIDLDDTTATVFIEDVIETDDGVLTSNDNAGSDTEVAANTTNTGTGSGGASDNGDATAAATTPLRAMNVPGTQDGGPGGNNRRRTNTNVLAEVIEQYRTVQVRLNPFVAQYYELLRNEPNYGESATEIAAREADQRVYDRVSEAFHYLSHAQHAISDLMLNLSQATPRFLTCRPILVEQSGYIRSNNILTPNIIPVPLRHLQDPLPQPQQQQQQQQQQPPLRNVSIAATNAAETAANAAVNAAQASGIADAAARTAAAAARSAALAASAAVVASTNGQSGTENAPLLEPTHPQTEDNVIEDPVDVAPNAASETRNRTDRQRQQQQSADDTTTAEIQLSSEPQPPRYRLYVPYNQQMSQMARLIQAVVNSATNDAELHLQINAPNVVSINVPVLGTATTGHSPTHAGSANTSLNSTNNDSLSSEQSPVSDSSSTTTNSANSTATPSTTGTATSTGSETPTPAVVTAITLPTTSTQTRSTARPQIQIGPNNNWNSGRFMSNTAFDRFLPCNSHHIRDPERLPTSIPTSRTGVSTSSSGVSASGTSVSTSSTGVSTGGTATSTRGSNVSTSGTRITTIGAGIPIRGTGISIRGGSIPTSSTAISANRAGTSTRGTNISTRGTNISSGRGSPLISHGNSIYERRNRRILPSLYNSHLMTRVPYLVPDLQLSRSPYSSIIGIRRAKRPHRRGGVGEGGTRSGSANNNGNQSLNQRSLLLHRRYRNQQRQRAHIPQQHQQRQHSRTPQQRHQHLRQNSHMTQRRQQHQRQHSQVSQQHQQQQRQRPHSQTPQQRQQHQRQNSRVAQQREQRQRQNSRVAQQRQQHQRQDSRVAQQRQHQQQQRQRPHLQTPQQRQQHQRQNSRVAQQREQRQRQNSRVAQQHQPYQRQHSQVPQQHQQHQQQHSQMPQQHQEYQQQQSQMPQQLQEYQHQQSQMPQQHQQHQHQQSQMPQQFQEYQHQQSQMPQQHQQHQQQHSQMPQQHQEYERQQSQMPQQHEEYLYQQSQMPQQHQEYQHQQSQMPQQLQEYQYQQSQRPQQHEEYQHPQSQMLQQYQQYDDPESQMIELMRQCHHQLLQIVQQYHSYRHQLSQIIQQYQSYRHQQSQILQQYQSSVHHYYHGQMSQNHQQHHHAQMSQNHQNHQQHYAQMPINHQCSHHHHFLFSCTNYNVLSNQSSTNGVIPRLENNRDESPMTIGHGSNSINLSGGGAGSGSSVNSSDTGGDLGNHQSHFQIPSPPPHLPLDNQNDIDLFNRALSQLESRPSSPSSEEFIRIIGQLDRPINFSESINNANTYDPDTTDTQPEHTNAATMTEACAGNSGSSATTNNGRDSGTSSSHGNNDNSGIDTTTLRSQLRNFITGRLFGNMPISRSAQQKAIDRALNWFKNNLLYLPQYEQPQYNARESVCNILRITLKLIIDLVLTEVENLIEPGAYEQRLKLICEQFRLRLFSVLIICVGRPNAELYWCQLMPRLSAALETNFRGEAIFFLIGYVAATIPITYDTADAQQFVVMRNSPELNAPSESEDVEMTDVASTSDSRASLSTSAVAPTENGIYMEHTNARSDAHDNPDTNAPGAVGNTEESTSEEAASITLPPVVAGSETWHAGIPNDWLPVISHDVRQQLEQTPAQPPYSDAYISGMSAKRRKIIQTEKSSANVESLIAEGVRRAMQATGFTASTASSPTLNADELTAAIARDPAVQSSYTEQIRFNVRERLKTDTDYKKEKYPQTAKFVDNKKKRF